MISGFFGPDLQSVRVLLSELFWWILDLKWKKKISPGNGDISAVNPPAAEDPHALLQCGSYSSNIVGIFESTFRSIQDHILKPLTVDGIFHNTVGCGWWCSRSLLTDP
ncbi:hypothetical protein AVEN_13839-1 [Araneus ventricosus]|uniref:Uncharacterized protein n=1 Tax=Araneus ventricosus TaxID=182803 RepID=A0A4Y2LF32_ARAVE|nr:hypothetical protein AVEN_13839-1 [Araneus ventricosus]